MNHIEGTFIKACVEEIRSGKRGRLESSLISEGLQGVILQQEKGGEMLPPFCLEDMAKHNTWINNRTMITCTTDISLYLFNMFLLSGTRFDKV